MSYIHLEKYKLLDNLYFTNLEIKVRMFLCLNCIFVQKDIHEDYGHVIFIFVVYTLPTVSDLVKCFLLLVMRTTHINNRRKRLQN